MHTCVYVCVCMCISCIFICKYAYLYRCTIMYAYIYMKLSYCGYICFGALTHFFRPNNKTFCYLV